MEIPGPGGVPANKAPKLARRFAARSVPALGAYTGHLGSTLGFTRGYRVLHPDQFQVNEAWIAFKLNDEPIHTEQDGDFDFIALMDAASCFILSSATVPAKRAEPMQMESRRLLKQGHAHKKQWPKTLFVPAEQPAQVLAAEAERLGIEVIRIGEGELLLIIGEAKEAFRERFGSGGVR